MAGSPGAGKTEFSKSFDPKSINYPDESPLVRIDADKIREMLPQFTGKNSDQVQPAATKGVEILFDYVQEHFQNVLIDTTFSDPHKSLESLRRAINRKRKVGIVYIHFDPVVAWLFTKAREIKEGRSVSLDFFIDSYFGAKDNVNKAKQEFRDKVELYLVEKEVKDKDIYIKTPFKIDDVDNFIKIKYNRVDLKNKLNKIKLD